MTARELAYSANPPAYTRSLHRLSSRPQAYSLRTRLWVFLRRTSEDLTGHSKLSFWLWGREIKSRVADLAAAAGGSK